PVHEIELRVVTADEPGRAAALFPLIIDPGLVALFARTGNRIAAPQLLAGLRVPAVDETANAELAAGNPGDDHAVRHERRHGHGVTGFEVDGLRAPHFLAGLDVERDDVGVERGAVNFVTVDRGAAVQDAATNDARRLGWILNHVFPDLAAGRRVDRDRALVVRHVHHAVHDQRLRLLAAIVVHAVAPYGNEALNGLTIDLIQRTVAFEVITHALGQYVVRRFGVILQVFGGDGRLCERRQQQQISSKEDFLHGVTPRVAVDLISVRFASR